MGEPKIVSTATQILLVDDDPVMRELAAAKLTEAGYVVCVACDGAEALALLKENDASLVISDLDMPVMNGFELTEAIRTDDELADMPVVVVTASDSVDAVDRAFAAGATSFLAKPINWSLFHQAVKFALRAHQDAVALREARDQAEAGSQFKDNLMSVMSHELRTPLNAIIGEQFDKEHDNMHREYAEYIVDSGRRLLNSVSDMLLASDARTGPVALTEVDVTLGGLIDEALGAMEKTMRLSGIEPELRICSRDIEVCCDRSLVVRALSKLIDNAVKFSPRGVPLLIGAAIAKNGDLAILVKDGGPGVKPERLAEVSAPFAQVDMSTKRSKEGLGLGLPLVQAIANAHGGAFRLQSTLGEGTRGVIVLPAARIVADSKARTNRQEVA